MTEPGNTFAKLPHAVLRRRDLPPMAKLLYAVLADRAGGNGAAWPGIRRLADDLGTDPKAALRAIRALRVAGLVTVESGGPGRTSRYTPASVGESPALANDQRCQNANIGVGESPAQVLANRQRECGRIATETRPSNQTQQPDQLTQTKGARRSGADDWGLAQATMTGTGLKTDAFKTAWLEWLRYRREARKPMTPSTLKAQIGKLEGWGHDAAVEAIQQSIANGWSGLFEPKADRSEGRRTKERPAGEQPGQGKPTDPRRMSIADPERYRHLL